MKSGMIRAGGFGRGISDAGDSCGVASCTSHPNLYESCRQLPIFFNHLVAADLTSLLRFDIDKRGVIMESPSFTFEIYPDYPPQLANSLVILLAFLNDPVYNKRSDTGGGVLFAYKAMLIKVLRYDPQP